MYGIGYNKIAQFLTKLFMLVAIWWAVRCTVEGLQDLPKMWRPIVYLFWVNPNNTYIVQFILLKIKRVVVKMALLKTNLLKPKRRRECGKQPPTAHSLFTTSHWNPSASASKSTSSIATCCRTRGIDRLWVDKLYLTLSSFSLADKPCLVWSFCSLQQTNCLPDLILTLFVTSNKMSYL